MDLLERGLRPRSILTREAFENAVTTVMALGGSTNAVLHLMAIAREAGVELELEDFDRISRRTPISAISSHSAGSTWSISTGWAESLPYSEPCSTPVCSTATP